MYSTGSKLPSMMHCNTGTKNMKPTTCRVCLGKSRGMLNIFESKLESGMSIADMLWEATGYPVIQGDSYPKTICLLCLQDGQSAFEIKETYEKSHRYFCEFQKNLQNEEDLPKSNMISIKEERLSPTIDQLMCEVKIELIEGDPLDILDVNHEFTDHGSFMYTSDELHGGVHEPSQFSECPKPYSAKEDLQTHLRKHTRERPYACTYCHRKFIKKTALEGHMITHTGERPYKCSQCPMSFTKKGYLKEHMNIHTGERPFKCSYCQQRFGKKETLRRHVTIHTGERPYKCSHCPSSFPTKSALDRHLQIHTERPYKCFHCEKTFPKMTALRVHLNKSPSCNTNSQNYNAY